MLKNIIVIVNTGLCLECCKLLKKAQLNILAVVSEDHLLQRWGGKTLILASPYIQLFWNEYQINTDRCDYNIVFDYEILGALNINLLNNGLHRLVSDKVLINSHLAYIDNKLFWKKNQQYCCT